MDNQDKRLFEEVYDEYYEKVFKSVYIRLLNMENTEDIVQDTFVKAMNAYDRFEPGSYDSELEKLTDRYARSAYRILSRLNEKERTLLSMRFGLEMSYKEMAEVLASNEKAVAKKMERLLEKCRNIAG